MAIAIEQRRCADVQGGDVRALADASDAGPAPNRPNRIVPREGWTALNARLAQETVHIATNSVLKRSFDLCLLPAPHTPH